MNDVARVVYWDASALLSVLFRDTHTDAAVACLERSNATHLFSSLAQAETMAVMARLARERLLSEAQVEAARTTFLTGPWRGTHIQPTKESVYPLARRWPLRGADLWHLACASTLRRQLPELDFLTYDKRLLEAAAGEGLLRG